ncbi:10405ab4-90d1-442c-bdaa-8729e8758e8b [Sclerotinia trifoliorum]|uniref:10405ab4-90d1-442c-bdaa-8729e8758e8b n=1 Tax=Sclerotinia trifoliorum TaxID=28548 RepID=A0A8H2VSY0_9HELO|nr:10405ab4-90d1-442c-bdaa-8729e8758e8b [Sclerotinia trifoliorum]
MLSGKESRPKSAWEERALLELLFRAPKSITDDDLLSISLSNLAKNLNDKLPASVIMNTYLRWLEAHRKSPSHLFKAWPNTTKHWVESLKTRGFDKRDVLSHVGDLRKVHGPFSNQSKGWAAEKYPPSVEEIERVFDEKHNAKKDKSLGKVDSGGGVYRSDKSSSKPGGSFTDHVPPNYICNRCGKHGHLVKQCPTNMDPAFDKQPPETYQCLICNKFGEHWYSLCPRNTKEDSITQKRLAAGIDVTTRHRSFDERNYHKADLDETSRLHDINHKGRDRDSRDCRGGEWEASERAGSAKQKQAIALDHDASEESELPTRNNKLELLADIEERIQKASVAMAQETGMSVEGVAEMTGVTISNMAATIMAATRKRARSIEFDDVGCEEYQRTTRQKFENDDNDELMHGADDERFLHSDDGRHDAESGGIFKETDPFTEEFELRQVLPSQSLMDQTVWSSKLSQFGLTMCPREMSPMDTSSEDNIRTPLDDMEEGYDSPRVRSETPEKIYTDFVKRLIENRSEGQIVNRRRPRRTALECWNEDDRRRMGQLNTSTSSPQSSPTVSSTSLLGSDRTDDAIEVDHPSEQALKEDPYFSLGKNTPDSPGCDIAMQEAMPGVSTHVHNKTY